MATFQVRESPPLFFNQLQLEETSEHGGFIVRLYEAYGGHAMATLIGHSMVKYQR